MDKESGTDDDQSSGWHEVRKKHRTNSKISVQKTPGEPNKRIHLSSRHKEALKNDKILEVSTVQGESLKRRSGLKNVDSNVSVEASSGLSSEETTKTIVCFSKQVGGQLVDRSVKAIDSTAALNVTKNDTELDMLGGLPKIKWGNIEDASFAVSVSGDSGKTKTDENAHFASCGLQKEQSFAADVNLDVFVSSNYAQDDDATSENAEESLIETCGEVCEVFSKYKDITNIELTNLSNNCKEKFRVSNMQNENLNGLASEDVDVESSSPSSHVGVAETNSEKCIDKSSVSEVSAVSTVAVVNDSPLHNLHVSKNHSAKVSADSLTSIEDVLSDGPDKGEDDYIEGKERFRERLWCFLFENMNRAVDELYLLCELECDRDQMNEVILVLEEAISDFRELKCRVENFEGTKRSSAQSSKDMAVTSLKTEHRRPHALSWEVRRMTTSPHRAEILSSSLEAFRKIQMERASKHATHDEKDLIFPLSNIQNCSEKSLGGNEKHSNGRKQSASSEIQRMEAIHENSIKYMTDSAASSLDRSCLTQAGILASGNPLISASGKWKKEPLETILEFENQASKKDKLLPANRIEKQANASDMIKKNNSLGIKEKEKDKWNAVPWKSMDAWKEKRNWEDILKSPVRSSSRLSCSPGVGRKSVERAKVLHDKLMSPEKKKKSALDMRKEAEERHARALRIRGQLENERLQRLQRVSEKFNRVNEWQAVRSLKLREGLNARQQRSESRHEAYLAQVVKRAGDESSKVNEVRFITTLNEENKKLILRQKLHDSELRRAEKMQTIKIKQKEDSAREEAALERRKLLEAEKMQRLAETQRKKEEAQLRREEERKASSAAREAKAVEQLRRKEIRAKAQLEEAELLAQKLAEKLSESEQRRKFYLEQIREKASTDFKDQSSPLLRRSVNREGMGRHITAPYVEDNQTTACVPDVAYSVSGFSYPAQQQSLKRRIKRIRQRLMALKHEFIEPPFFPENLGFGYRTLIGTARAKIGKWLQELQRLRQARKEGAVSIGLIVSDMIKFLEGKDIELYASRQAGLLDFISSALPASHTSKPESGQITVYLLRLLRVVLSVPVNRGYFLALNLLPPVIPMLSASLDNYIKIAASSNSSSSNFVNKMPTDNMETIAEVLDCFLHAVTTIMGYTTIDERELQMQDGLLELIVSYQVIHRLHDLFTLYDRPQVDGFPFPSSIILSLNLLAVLTSRRGSLSTINWEAGIYKSTTKNLNEDSQMIDCNDAVDKFVMKDTSGDIRFSQFLQTVTLPQTSELMAADESTQMHMIRLHPGGFCHSDASETVLRIETSDLSVNLNKKEDAASMIDTVTVGSQNVKPGEPTNSPLEQKIQKTTMDNQACRKLIDESTMLDNSEKKKGVSKQPMAFLLSVIADTGLVSLTSLLTAVLLQANGRLSSDQTSYVLPSNFEEVAIGVLKILNNVACLDLSLLQKMLARSDLRMEFFHLISFLLSHCISRWKSANDQISLLLLESLLLLGYFSLFHAGNQAVLCWGKTPTILHKICDLPFVFFSDPELTPILAGTLIAACYGCEQNRGMIQQELSIEMILSLLRSCRLEASLLSPPDTNSPNVSPDVISSAPEAKKTQNDSPLRLNRRGVRSVPGRGGINGTRVFKYSAQRDNRATKTLDDWALKHNLPASEASYAFMLHRRFPPCFLDRAEEFFSVETSNFRQHD